MALVIDVSQLTPGLTKRQLIRECGLSVGLKGRFKPEAQEIIDLAEKAGYVFGAPAAAVNAPVKAVVSQKELDLEAFRTWEASKGYPESTKRISNELINEYVAENPDFKRRQTAPVKTTVKSVKADEVKPLPNYDVKALRAWAKERDIELNARGRIKRSIIEDFIADHESNGTPLPEREEPEDMFRDTMARINMADHWEAIDLDGKKIRKSYKDGSAGDTRNSIGWEPLPVYAWSQVDPDLRLELSPVF